MSVEVQELHVSLHISPQEYQRMYRGEAGTVHARDNQGRRIQFPASALQKFVTHQGIHGVFVLRIDSDNKLIDIHRRQD